MPSPDPPPDRRRRVRRVVAAAASLLLAAILIGVVLPAVAGVPWTAVGRQLASVSPGRLAVLGGVWLGGLLAHSVVLTAALPGLTTRRALTLNLTGSAVSNVVPLGGALGIGLNIAMARRWGFPAGQVTRYAAVTNAWNVVGKAALAPLALVLLPLVGPVHSGGLATTVASVALASAAVLGGGFALVRSDRVAATATRAAQATANRALRLARSRQRVSLETSVQHFRATSRALVAAAWRRMTAGMLAYLALQAALLFLCLRSAHAHVGLAGVVIAFAVERALSIAPITPGGAGVAEAGMTAVLLALGAGPVSATAGVLLYRAFVFGLEIPVGGLGVLGWAVLHRPRWRSASPDGRA